MRGSRMEKGLGEQKELDRQRRAASVRRVCDGWLASLKRRTEALYAAKAQLTPYALVLLGFEAAYDARAGEAA
ncbi:MAG: hypothetical protein U0Q16_14190 [Bryobacteraceae bacterium]